MAQRVARSPFRLFGWLGFVAAFVLCLGLTVHQRGSLWGLLSISAASIVSFFALALATKVITGIRDRLRVNLPVRSLFTQPTPSGLAELVEQVRNVEALSDTSS